MAQLFTQWNGVILFSDSYFTPATTIHLQMDTSVSGSVQNGRSNFLMFRTMISPWPFASSIQ